MDDIAKKIIGSWIEYRRPGEYGGSENYHDILENHDYIYNKISKGKWSVEGDYFVCRMSDENPIQRLFNFIGWNEVRHKIAEITAEHVTIDNENGTRTLWHRIS